MKLAIHNGDGWNLAWKKYCDSRNISFIDINCYDNNIIKQLKQNGITHLMWHFDHNKPTDILMARNVLYSANKIGIKTFPNFNTCWHFDDKVSQKYLLEAIDAPLVPSYAFYSKREALEWLKTDAKYPIVAKLRRGAGSYNVQLIRNYAQAHRYTNKMFGKGIHPTPGFFADTKNKLKVAGNFSGIITRLKKAPNFFKVMYSSKKGFPKEKGYVYFQDFIPNNKEDIRIAVVGNKIWSFKRKVRSGDFRASGSGMIDYNTLNLPKNLLKISFEISKKLNTQSIAFDFVKDSNDNYFIVEISYGYQGDAINNCHGYWDENLNFTEGHFYPEPIIIQDFINENC